VSEVTDLLFNDAPLWSKPEVAENPDVLTVDIAGWEGPLDLLLTLARNQKVDLRQISILELVHQYLNFIDNARALKLEVAADYLVMAAWLAYLKSALLLPKDPGIDPSPEELALRLQLRLERLNAMRESGARLMARDRLGRDVFRRGAPEGLRVTKSRTWDCNYFELVAAYGQIRARTQPVLHVVKKRAVMTLEEALTRVSAMIDKAIDWTQIESFLPVDANPALRKSALASSFSAALELAKRGQVDLMQEESFAPLMLRVRQ
jgi:segregation and condensation protein A